MALTRRTRTHQYLAPDGTPCVGTVTFTVGTTEPISDLGEPATILTERIDAPLDANGQISASLICNDDPDVDPTDWPWVVDEDVRTGLGVGVGRPRYGIMVSTGDPATIDLDSTIHFPPWAAILDTTPLRAMLGTATLDFPSIPAGATADLTVTVTGAAVGDHAIPAPTTLPPAGITWQATVTAADTATVRLANTTAGAIDPPAVTFHVLVLRA